MLENFITEHCYLFLVIAILLLFAQISLDVWRMFINKQALLLIEDKKQLKRLACLNAWYRKILIEIYDQDYIERAEQEFIEKHQL